VSELTRSSLQELECLPVSLRLYGTKKQSTNQLSVAATSRQRKHLRGWTVKFLPVWLLSPFGFIPNL